MTVTKMLRHAIDKNGGSLGVADVRGVLDCSDQRARDLVAQWLRLGLIERGTTASSVPRVAPAVAGALETLRIMDILQALEGPL